MRQIFLIAFVATILSSSQTLAQSDDLTAINHKVVEKAPKLITVSEVEHDTINHLGKLHVVFESNAYPVTFLPWREGQSELDRYKEMTVIGCDTKSVDIIVPYELTEPHRMRAYLFFAKNIGGSEVAGYAFSLPKPVVLLK